MTTETLVTRQIRVRADLAEMLSAILYADTDQTTAEFVDPLLRPSIEQRFKALPAAIRQRALDRIAELSKPD